MSVDEGSLSSNKQVINISSTSTTPNYTQTSGNTSQSMTPSEFGYHHLNRQSNAVSLESSPKSDVYEHLEQAFKNTDQGMGPTLLSLSSSKSKSPIKSTINITYNIKSPMSTTHENVFFGKNSRDIGKSSEAKNILETSFDESMVYEQIHVFNSTVSEINNMLDNGNENDGQRDTPTNYSMESDVGDGSNNATSQIVPVSGKEFERSEIKESQSSIELNPTEVNRNVIDIKEARKMSDADDVPMPDQELDIQDSLEIDPNISLYENVQLRKPATLYANVLVSSSHAKLSQNATIEHSDNAKVEDDEQENRPSSFTVRQLANKFQTSPCEVRAPFDFTKPFTKKANDVSRNSPCLTKAKNTKHLNKSAKITRSLDENAFVREFGNGKLHENINKSTQQLPEIINVLSENSPSRRSSAEYTRPKSLNPPKRLPDMTPVANEACKTDATGKLKIELNTNTNNDTVSATNFDIKITPTTENPISLIQHNVGFDTKNGDDEKCLNSISSVKGIGNFKLDRERIEKIKEERRHQLNEKFRSESFKCDTDYNKLKSKSKTELTELKESDRKIGGSLQFKSKSRAEIYNMKDADSPSALTLAQSFGGSCVNRIRRISDEKNQNTCNEDFVPTDLGMGDEADNVAAKSRKFERRPTDIRRDPDGFTVPQKKIVNPQ